MKQFAIIRRSYLWLIWGAGVAVIAAILFFLNFNLSIEFTGGVEVSLNSQSSVEKVENTLTSSLQDAWYENVKVSANRKVDDTLSVVMNLGLDNDSQVKEASDKIQEVLTTNEIISNEADILGMSLIGPSIGANMKTTTTYILIAGLLAVAVYMMFSFSWIRDVVSPTKLAIVTIITMIFDLTITAWAYSLYMMWDPTIQINTVFVTAMLMIMWYSINDTIVILDRIRENITKGKEDKIKMYGPVFEKSIWQTMRRSIGTSLSTFLVVFVLFIFSFMYSATLIQHFAFVLSVWVIAGTYSSIFIAAPLVYILLWRFKKEVKSMK